MKILKIVIINSLAWTLPLFGDQNVSDHFYKDLSSEVDLLKSYYLKAEQSSEIAQTRFQRGLFSMSELSAMRAIGQFTYADESIDEYVSKVAGANIRGVMPWNKKLYKQKLMDKALELRLLLSVQEEDLQALLGEVEKQLDSLNLASTGLTLERIDQMIKKLQEIKAESSAEEAEQIQEALAVLGDTKSMILDGVEQEVDISELVQKASQMVDDLEKSELFTPNVNNNQANIDPQTDAKESSAGLTDTPKLAKFFNPEGSSNFQPKKGSTRVSVDEGKQFVDGNLPANNLRRTDYSLKNIEDKNSDNVGLKIISDPGSSFSTIETADGRKIRVSRPPQDWPNGRANGYDSIYDDRPGGNLIKEEEIVFERVVLPQGSYSVKEVNSDRNERKWDFKITETGGLEERYSIANMANLSDFEVKSWILRNQQSEIVDKLDGNNLHFSPGELAEGDYSLEVEGVTGWSSPFTVVASVLR
jgi:hypothetical protein